MRTQNITIDINRLDSDQLENLAAMCYGNGDMQTTKKINDRIAFLLGWMSEKQEEKYISEFC